MNKVKVLSIFLVAAVLILVGCSYQAAEVKPALIEVPEQETDRGQRLLSLVEGVVSPPVITSHSHNGEVDSPIDYQLIFIEGYSMPRNRLEIKVNGLLKGGSVSADDEGFFRTEKGVEIIEGRNRIEVTAVRSDGKKSKPTVFDLFLNVPQRVEYTIYDDPQNLREISSIYFLKEAEPQVYIQGTYLPEAEIYVEVNGDVVAEARSVSGGDFSFSNIRLRKGENEIAVWGKTQDQGLIQPVFRNILVTSDSQSPYPSSLKGYSDAFGNHLSWTASTDQDFYSYKLVRVTDPCLNPQYPDHDVIATFNERGAASYTDEDIMPKRAYFYTLWTLDKAGNAISSNVLGLPGPVYSIDIKRMPPFESNTVGRRQWYYQYYRITNTGNVTVDLQPIMVWIKLEPDPRAEDLFPLWETHLWDADSGQYYYNNKEIEKTYIPDYWAIEEITETGDIYEYRVSKNGDMDGDNEEMDEGETIEVRDIVTRRTHRTEGKRIMETTSTTVHAHTGEVITKESMQVLVSPEKVGSPIENIHPGHSVEIAVKIQNVTAEPGDQITVHFHFAPVDCDGYFFTDEEVSTEDITVISTGRN